MIRQLAAVAIAAAALTGCGARDAQPEAACAVLSDGVNHRLTAAQHRSISDLGIAFASERQRQGGSYSGEGRTVDSRSDALLAEVNTLAAVSPTCS